MTELETQRERSSKSMPQMLKTQLGLGQVDAGNSIQVSHKKAAILCCLPAREQQAG